MAVTTIAPGITGVGTGISETLFIQGGGGTGGPTLVNVAVNSTEDQAPIITAAYNAAAALDWRVLYLPAGRISIQSPIIPVSGITLAGMPGQTILVEDKKSFIVSARGSVNTTQGNALASNSIAGSDAVTLVAGKGANIPPNTWNLLVSEVLVPNGGGPKQAEFVFVETVVADTMNLSGPIYFDYNTSDSAQVFTVTFLEDLGFEDLIFDSLNPGTDAVSPTPPDPDDATTRVFCGMEWCLRPKFTRCTFRHGRSAGLYMMGCVEGACNDCYGDNLLSNDANAFGYFNVETGPCLGFTQRNAKVHRCRHGYTNVATQGSPNSVFTYGVPIGSRIYDGLHVNPKAAGWDTHPGAGYYQEFHNCSVLNGRQGGFQIRAIGGRIFGGSVEGCIGAGIYTTSTAIDSRIEGTLLWRTNIGIDDNGFDWRQFGAIFSNAIQTDIKGCTIEECGGPGIYINAGIGGVIQDNLIRDPLRLMVDIPLVTTAAVTDPPGLNVLTFASVPNTVIAGMEVLDQTTPGAIPADTIIALDPTATTVALSANAGGVLSGHSIFFTNRSGIWVNSNNIAGDINIYNNRIMCSDTNMNYGIYQTRVVPFTYIYNNVISGAQIQPVRTTSGRLMQVTNNGGGNLWNIGGSAGSGGIGNTTANSIVRIVSGVIDVSNLAGANAIIESEDGLADTVTQIVGGQNADCLVLRRSASVSITLKQTTGGAENLFMAKATDVVLDNSYTRVLMQKQGTAWLQLNAPTATIPLEGSGSPESVVTGTVGTLYLNRTQTAAATIYAKYTTSGNTGWKTLVTAQAVTFAGLPSSPIEGMMIGITDSTKKLWGETIAGGGAFRVLAYYNGSNWLVAAAAP